MTGVVPPDPPLAGPRVLLRPFRAQDAAAVAAACQDPDVPRFTMMPAGMTEESARGWIAHTERAWAAGVARFAVTVPPSDECLGQMGIGFEPELRRAEVFYWLTPGARGRGLAAEALGLVTGWAFEAHDVVRVQLVTHVENAGSQAVARRCGYTREGVLRAWMPIKDTRPDVVMWSRLASDPAGGGSSTPVGARTTLDDVLEVLDLADGCGARLWLDGGWGVDALLGGQTREHGDLDVAIEHRHLAPVLDALAGNGFVHVGEEGATAWNFLLARAGGPVVDLHVVVLDRAGNGVLGPAEAGSIYPAAALTGRGRVGDREVDCISPEWVVRFRDRYPGDADDRADVRALCARFDLDIPGQYR